METRRLVKLDNPDPRHLRNIFGMFATGVTVVTSLRDKIPYGMTANSFTSVSLDPPLVLVCVRRGSPLTSAIIRNPLFGISILTDEQGGVARYFANSRRGGSIDHFGGLPYESSPDGTPFIPEALANLECRLESMYSGGDHVICVGRVLGVQAEWSDPLVFFTGRFSALSGREILGGAEGQAWPWI